MDEPVFVLEDEVALVDFKQQADLFLCEDLLKYRPVIIEAELRLAAWAVHKKRSESRTNEKRLRYPWNKIDIKYQGGINVDLSLLFARIAERLEYLDQRVYGPIRIPKIEKGASIATDLDALFSNNGHTNNGTGCHGTGEQDYLYHYIFKQPAPRAYGFGLTDLVVNGIAHPKLLIFDASLLPKFQQTGSRPDAVISMSSLDDPYYLIGMTSYTYSD